MFKRFKITCNEATTICDKSQYGAASLSEKLKLSIHFLNCKICSLYTKQNNLLTKVYKSHAKGCKKTNFCLSNQEKETLKKDLEKNNS